jgi:hypothetical protein
MFGMNFDVTLETVFTTLEHMINSIEFRGDNREFKKEDYKSKQDLLKQAIAAVLEDSLTKGKTSVPKKCLNHNRFVEEKLKPTDEIVGFNYDCVLDCSLKYKGDEKWNARYGYGFDLGPKGKYLTGDDHWQPTVKATKDQTVKYYKLHGSLHFNISKTEDIKQKISLKQRPYTKQNGNLKFDIIPPEWNKDIYGGLFSKLWMKAGLAIHKARHIILIGYALPPTDLHSAALFRTALTKDSLASLTIVNPDPEARRQTRDVFLRGLSTNTKVLSFNYWEEFLAAERALWEV